MNSFILDSNFLRRNSLKSRHFLSNFRPSYLPILVNWILIIKWVFLFSKRRSRGGGRGHLKPTTMVNCKENWPQMGKSGLSMNFIENKNGVQYFAYEHSQSYRQTQNKFLDAVESLNPDNIVALINDHPYHIDALIQLSNLCKLSEDLAMAAGLIERALYYLEYAYHPLFNVAQGNCRLDYRRQENR